MPRHSTSLFGSRRLRASPHGYSHSRLVTSFFGSRRLRASPQGYSPWTSPLERFVWAASSAPSALAWLAFINPTDQEPVQPPPPGACHPVGKLRSQASA